MREMFITLILLMRTQGTRGTREVKHPVQVMQAARGRVETQTKVICLPELGPGPINLSASLPPIPVDDRGSVHLPAPQPALACPSLPLDPSISPARPTRESKQTPETTTSAQGPQITPRTTQSHPPPSDGWRESMAALETRPPPSRGPSQ